MYTKNRQNKTHRLNAGERVPPLVPGDGYRGQETRPVVHRNRTQELQQLLLDDLRIAVHPVILALQIHDGLPQFRHAGNDPRHVAQYRLTGALIIVRVLFRRQTQIRAQRREEDVDQVVDDLARVGDGRARVHRHVLVDGLRRVQQTIMAEYGQRLELRHGVIRTQLLPQIRLLVARGHLLDVVAYLVDDADGDLLEAVAEVRQARRHHVEPLLVDAAHVPVPQGAHYGREEDLLLGYEDDRVDGVAGGGLGGRLGDEDGVLEDDQRVDQPGGEEWILQKTHSS